MKVAFVRQVTPDRRGWTLTPFITTSDGVEFTFGFETGPKFTRGEIDIGRGSWLESSNFTEIVESERVWLTPDGEYWIASKQKPISDANRRKFEIAPESPNGDRIGHLIEHISTTYSDPTSTYRNIFSNHRLKSDRHLEGYRTLVEKAQVGVVRSESGFRAVAFHNLKRAITIENIEELLRALKTRAITAARSTARQLQIVFVQTDREFTSALLSNDEHAWDAIVINENQSTESQIDGLTTELRFLLQQELKMSVSPKIVRSFVQAQLDVDKKQKELVARWATDDLPQPLQPGSGVFLDAGSTTLEVWESLKPKIVSRELANPYILTSSLLILKDFAENYADLFEAQVDVSGVKFDAMHQAFYDDQIKILEVLMSAVYIGTSGIDVDPNGRILLGYHQGADERLSKENLFRIPARQRIILVTPKKVGNPGGHVLDVLSIDNLDVEGTIYLVTTEPIERDSEEFERFRRVLSNFYSDQTQHMLKNKRLKMQWVILDSKMTDAPREIPDWWSNVKND